MNEARRQATRLWTVAQPVVSAFVTSVIRDFKERDDVLQDIAVAAIESFDAYDVERPFVPWVMGVARNQVGLYLRRRRRDRPGGRIFQPGNEGRRSQPLQATVWPPVVVVHPPLVENNPSLRQAQEQLAVEQLVPKPAVEALHVTVLPWARLLDGERANARPRQPLLNLLGNELGPVVAPQVLGCTPHGEQVLRVMITSRAVKDRATSIARHSLVNSSIATRIRSCLPSSVRSVRKS